MKTMISILLLVSITSGGLFYLYSEDGPVQKWEQEEDAAYNKAVKDAEERRALEATKQ
jgi:hypothetical protein